MASEMLVFARFLASCLKGFAPPVVRPSLPRPANGLDRGRAVPSAVAPVRHFRASPAPTERSRTGRERQGLVHKANGLVGFWFPQC